MTADPKANVSLKKRRVIGCVLILFLLFLGGILYYWTSAFQRLMSVEEIQYNNPNQSQIDYFLECCDLRDIQIENADCLLISESPHKSDSLMAIVFSGDVTDWWDGFVNYPEGCSISLPNHNTLNYDAEKRISTFICAYRLRIYGENKSLLLVTNVSDEAIRQIIERASLSTPAQPVESASPVPVPEISERDIEEPVIPIPTWEHFEYADEPCSIELPEDLLAHAEIYTRSPNGENRIWSVPAEHIDACHQVIKDHLWREIYVQGLPVAYSQNAGVKVIRFAYQVEKIYPDQEHSALRTYETALYCIDGQLCFTMGIHAYLPFYQAAQGTIEASMDTLIDLTTPEDPDEIQHLYSLEAPECDRWGECEILRIFPETDLVIIEGEGYVKSERILAELSCGEITDITDLTSFEAEDSSIIDCYDIPLRGRIDGLRSGQTVVHATYDKYACVFRVEVH